MPRYSIQNPEFSNLGTQFLFGLANMTAVESIYIFSITMVLHILFGINYRHEIIVYASLVAAQYTIHNFPT